jgi:NAD+ synthase
MEKGDAMLRRTINTSLVRTILVQFIRKEMRKAGFSKGIVGLSGGVDSSLVVCLAAEALGPENVFAVAMPYRLSNPESEAHAALVAKQLHVDFQRIDLSPMIDAYFERFPDADALRRGNKLSRERMAILYDLSAAHSGLVLGTSNKTELLLGYGTIYGDMASALNPIGDLYKTHVRHLAEAVGVPKEIIEKAPSADLWAGQTDEEELRYPYDQIDQLLYHMVDLRLTEDELIRAGFAIGFVRDIKERIRRSRFKRRLPVIARVSDRTIDRDFRCARD